MTAKGRSMLARARRLNAQRGGPRLLTIIGDPEIRRLKNKGLLAPMAMASNREAMVNGDLYAAEADESTKAFHARMLKIAEGRGAFWVCLGHPVNVEPMKEAPPRSDGSLLPDSEDAQTLN